MTFESSKRERKKLRTREMIGEAARRLFFEHGFEAVTVIDVAKAAGVSEGTVFNYFPTKEDLFYGGTEAFESVFVDVVRRRPEGESALSAFRRLVLDSATSLASEEVGEVVAGAALVIGASRSLQAREREILARYTNSLATLLAQETGAGATDIEPWMVANALMGVQRAFLAHVRAEAIAGRSGPTLAENAERQAARAFARLETGLGDYAIKPAEPGRASRL